MLFCLQRANCMRNMQGKNIIKYLKLIIIFLGQIRPQSICFRAFAKYFPSKSLYSKRKIFSYKIYFFRIQFKIIGSKQLAEIEPAFSIGLHQSLQFICYIKIAYLLIDSKNFVSLTEKL